MSLPPRWFSREDRRDPRRAGPGAPPRGPKVVIVGPCASGKSTLAAGLRELGFDAVPVGQEHSDIPTLWRRSGPDVLVALDVDLDTIRHRRSEADWPEWLYDAQLRRLSQAASAAALRIEASSLSAAEVLACVARFLDEAGVEGNGAAGDQLGENPSPA